MIKRGVILSALNPIKKSSIENEVNVSLKVMHAIFTIFSNINISQKKAGILNGYSDYSYIKFDSTNDSQALNF